jgi:O-acetyl-ADP-ribose deacetylase (regulator of RNase III)
MKIIKGDIFKGEWDAIGTCCNIYCTWGAGIVIPLKKLYPEAFQADLKTIKGDKGKLGGFSFAQIGEKTIYNLYGQTGIGNDGNPLNRNCQYDFIFDSLYRSCEHLCKTNFESKLIYGLPKIGAGLGGGDWHIIKSIIEVVESKFTNIEFNIYYLPEKE